MENQIKRCYEEIKLPTGAETLIQKKIEENLGKPMREMKVILKPRRSILRPVLQTAAVLALIFLGMLGLKQLRNVDPTSIEPAAQPGTLEVQDTEGIAVFAQDLSYPLEKNTGNNAVSYPYMIHTPSATWYLSAEDIAAQGEEAFFRGLEQLLQIQEADFADARAALAPYLQEEIPPIDIYTDFSGHAEESAIYGAYYNSSRREIRLFQNWDIAAYALLHEYTHYLSMSCTDRPTSSTFFREGLAEYISNFVCENRMLRLAYRSVIEEEEDFARRCGIWDEEKDSIDPARNYLFMAEKSRDPSVIGVKYNAVSGGLITRTERINDNPSFGNISYYELGGMFAYLVDTYGEDAVFGNWDKDLPNLQELFGKNFTGIYWDWLDWNREQREALGIDIA